MGQARGLGIDGPLLREFGLAALMHDIGKVKTPLEMLNKPDKLTDDEFAIMKRHTVDGAEILRRTPDIPALAPVVAFEHHLRLDGSGYPNGVSRPTLNLGTMLCSIADVYDAMRSQRAVPAVVPDRSHSRGAEAERRSAVRSAPGPALRAADRHLSRGQSGAAEHRRSRRRPPGLRARPASSLRARPVFERTANASTCRTTSTCGRPATKPSIPRRSSAPLDPADFDIDPLTLM